MYNCLMLAFAVVFKFDQRARYKELTTTQPGYTATVIIVVLLKSVSIR